MLTQCMCTTPRGNPRPQSLVEYYKSETLSDSIQTVLRAAVKAG